MIELLVVILIIGILAAIAIPSFLSQRSKGRDACAMSMVSTMHKAMAIHVMYLTTPSYTGVTTANLTAVDPSIRNNGCGALTPIAIGRQAATGSCTLAADAARYCIRATSASGNIFSIQRAANGAITRVCRRIESRGACKGTGTSGTW